MSFAGEIFLKPGGRPQRNSGGRVHAEALLEDLVRGLRMVGHWLGVCSNLFHLCDFKKSLSSETWESGITGNVIKAAFGKSSGDPLSSSSSLDSLGWGLHATGTLAAQLFAAPGTEWPFGEFVQ